MSVRIFARYVLFDPLSPPECSVRPFSLFQPAAFPPPNYFISLFSLSANSNPIRILYSASEFSGFH